MEITAALFVAIAPIAQVAPHTPEFQFVDILSEAVNVEPAEPSAWTLLNPLNAPEDSEMKVPDPSEAPEEPERS